MADLNAIASVLPIKDHTVRLINRRDTLETFPLANLQNIQAAVHAIGNVMDKDEDVLVLFMTSHGEQTGFALQLPERHRRTDAAASRRDARRRGHQEPRGDRFGLLFGNFRAAAGERQHHRHDRRGREEHVIRLRPRTRLDLFRRRLLSARACIRERISKTRSIMPAS